MSTPRRTYGPIDTRKSKLKVTGNKKEPINLTASNSLDDSGNGSNESSGLSANQQFVTDKYQEIFGRDPSFGTLGGADYWVDKLDTGAHTQDDVIHALLGSQEAQTGTLGGLNESLSMTENAAAGNVWAGHFAPGGGLSAGTDLSNTIWAGLGTGAGNNWGTDNAAGAANNIAASVGYVPNNLGGQYYNQGITGGGDTIPPNPTDPGTIPPTPGGLTIDDLNNWWAQQNQNQGGMDDFMRFMMLMSVMGNSGMGGGGYGGSQYGYGGLTPGGVHPSSNSLDQLAGLSSWFQDNFGSGGATTGTVNTGTGTT